MTIFFSVPTVFAGEETSENLDFFLDEGNKSFNTTNYEDAISSYDKVLVQDPSHIAALAKKGDALVNLGKVEEAISYLSKVVDIDPSFVDEQGTLYLDKLLELAPDNVEFLYKKANSIVIYHDKFDEAISYLDRVLEIEPNHVNALYTKGEAYFQQDKFDEAIMFYDKALEIDPNNANALSSKGYALAKLDDFENSNILFDKALEIQPDNPNVLYKRGSAFLVEGNADDALTYFYDALKIDPHHYLADIKLKFVAKNYPYKKLDGFVDNLVYDSQGFLVGHLKVRDLWYIDHGIFNKTIDEWPVTKIINLNGKDYEVRQLEQEYDIEYRNWEGGIYQYGVYFPLPDSDFEIIKTSYWLYHVDKGDKVKIIRTVFRPV